MAWGAQKNGRDGGAVSPIPAIKYAGRLAHVGFEGFADKAFQFEGALLEGIALVGDVHLAVADVAKLDFGFAEVAFHVDGKPQGQGALEEFEVVGAVFGKVVLAGNAELVVVEVEEEGVDHDFFAEHLRFDADAVDADVVVLFAPVFELQQFGHGGNALVVHHYEVFAVDGGGTEEGAHLGLVEGVEVALGG